MAGSGKLLVGDKDTILLLPVYEDDSGVPNVITSTGLLAFDALTDEAYNQYIPIVTNGTTGAGHGGNITCTISDDFTLGSTDPEIDDSKTPCSRGASGEIKRYNFEAEIDIFRDADLTSTSSAFNMASDLVRAADIPYLIAHRVGYSSSTVSDGHKWNLYYVHTDNPIDVVADDENIMRHMAFIPKGIIKFEQGAL